MVVEEFAADLLMTMSALDVYLVINFDGATCADNLSSTIRLRFLGR